MSAPALAYASKPQRRHAYMIEAQDPSEPRAGGGRSTGHIASEQQGAPGVRQPQGHQARSDGDVKLMLSLTVGEAASCASRGSDRVEYAIALTSSRALYRQRLVGLVNRDLIALYVRGHGLSMEIGV